MWEKSDWSKGHCFDNHQKYACWICGKSFIVGKQLLKNSSFVTPICPYCGSGQTRCDAEAAPDQLKELADALGGLGIYIDNIDC